MTNRLTRPFRRRCLKDDAYQSEGSCRLSGHFDEYPLFGWYRSEHPEHDQPKAYMEEMMTTDSVRGFIEKLISIGRLPKSKRNDPDAVIRAIHTFVEGIREYERNDEFEREEAQYELDQAAAIDPFWSYRVH